MDSPLHSTSSQSSTMSKPRTKAAMKGYENFKVSIPTNGLDLQQALNRSPNPTGCKLAALADIALGNDVPHAVGLIPSMCSPVEPAKTLPLHDNKVADDDDDVKHADHHILEDPKQQQPTLVKRKTPTGNKLGFNQRKKKNPAAITTSATQRNKKPTPNKQVLNQSSTPKDIYDFEDSRDSNDSPILPLTRTKTTDSPEPNTSKDAILEEESQVSSYSDRDDYNFEESLSESESSSSSNESHTSSVQTKRSGEKSINNVQKKCLIMGRIFKSVKKADSQSKDTAAAIDNRKEVKEKAKPLPKQELDKMFDSLRGGGGDDSTVGTAKTTEHQTEVEKVDSSKSKRNTKSAKKSTSKSSGASKAIAEVLKSSRRDNSRRAQKSREIANLEAEWNMSMEEIIMLMGVEQRKTQRRCATSKQKNCVETWSSDEYEEFHSNKDIFALIAEAETKATRNKNKAAKANKKLGESVENVAATTTAKDCSKNELNLENSKSSTTVQVVHHTSQDSKGKEKIDNSNDETSRSKKKFQKAKKSTSFVDVESTASINDAKTKHNSENEAEKRSEVQMDRAKAIKKRRRTIAFKEDDEVKPERRSSQKSKSSASDAATTNSGVKLQGPSNQKSTATSSSASHPKLMPRRKRIASEMLYYWSSSSDEEFGRIKPRDNFDDDNLEQHGWIVGDSHKKLVTLLAHAKGKKIEDCGVKEAIHKKSHK